MFVNRNRIRLNRGVVLECSELIQRVQMYMVQLLCRAFFTQRLRVRCIDRRRYRRSHRTGLVQRRNLLDHRTHPRVLGTLQ